MPYSYVGKKHLQTSQDFEEAKMCSACVYRAYSQEYGLLQSKSVMNGTYHQMLSDITVLDTNSCSWINKFIIY